MEDEDFVLVEKQKDDCSIAKPNLFGVVAQAVLEEKSHSLIEVLARRKKTNKSINEDYSDDRETIRRRLKDSDHIISELFRDGRELIQDIQVANDKREVQRRVREAEIREDLLETLHVETVEAMARFECISEKWKEIKELKDPMGINDELQLQKHRIKDLMKQKDIIIQECQKELNAADERYTRDLLKQTTDIHSLISRIDDQIEIIKRAFKEHVDLLENTIDDEKQTLCMSASKNWDDLYTRRAVNERIKIKQEIERLEFYRNEIDRVEQEQIEVARATRIRLEQDNQVLEIELQKVKTKTTLNSEKLDYNFQVLKKREDENLLVRNAQKRRLTKLNETIFHLRKKIKDVQMICLMEVEKITSDIIALQTNINHINSKVNAFSEMNDKNYHHVWQMHKNECITMLNDVLKIDEELVEKHLGLKWQTPPMKDDRIQKILHKTDIVLDGDQLSCGPSPVSRLESTNEIKEIWDTLQTIIRQAGFLADNNAINISEQYTQDKKHLVRIDTILNALGVSNWDDVQKLKQKLKYVTSSSCTRNCEYFRDPNLFDAEQNEVHFKDSEAGSIGPESISLIIPSNKQCEPEGSLEQLIHVESIIFQKYNSLEQLSRL
ncbi:dynein regulatory complex protein 1 homolog isoform X2 [Wyeomyia smithii]|uniref:dynein regulatory complex protein 1 homolog isoform X2 n=1 Tax=Wyeomyia smithii TaxID=174621 RepID=UPI002467EACE|nr:dynein regulatory complex protein 1 homolog isoform X2 [Wyeomyia smithii]